METEDGRVARARAQREERRAQILDVAVGVFAAKGYHGTSISDLVDAAGIARGTFYQYFDSKHAIFAELLDRLQTGFRASMVGVDTRPQAVALEDQLVAIVGRVLDAASSNRAVTTIIFREALAMEAELVERLHAFEAQLQAWVGAALDNGIAMGLLRPHDTTIVAAAVYGSIRQVISTAPDADQGHAAREIVAFALRGVRA